MSCNASFWKKRLLEAVLDASVCSCGREPEEEEVEDLQMIGDSEKILEF